MHLEEFDPGNPGTRQILVRVRAASVNPIDLKVRSGTVKFITGNRFPSAMGTDFSDIVEAVSLEVTRPNETSAAAFRGRAQASRRADRNWLTVMPTPPTPSRHQQGEDR